MVPTPGDNLLALNNDRRIRMRTHVSPPISLTHSGASSAGVKVGLMIWGLGGGN